MLENTDKALAGIVDAIGQLSHQVQPDVYETASKVAMLSAQGDMLSAHIFFWLGIAVFVFGIFISAVNGIADNEGTSGFTFCVAILGLIVMGINCTTLYSPLSNAATQDGKVALAKEVIEHMKTH